MSLALLAFIAAGEPADSKVPLLAVLGLVPPVIMMLWKAAAPTMHPSASRRTGVAMTAGVERRS